MITTIVPERPPKPITAQLRFAKDYRAEHKGDPEKITLKSIGKAFKELTESARNKYINAFDKDMLKYNEAIEKYEKLLKEKGFVSRAIIGGPDMEKILINMGLYQEGNPFSKDALAIIGRFIGNALSLLLEKVKVKDDEIITRECIEKIGESAGEFKCLKEYLEGWSKYIEPIRAKRVEDKKTREAKKKEKENEVDKPKKKDKQGKK